MDIIIGGKELRVDRVEYTDDPAKLNIFGCDISDGLYGVRESTVAYNESHSWVAPENGCDSEKSKHFIQSDDPMLWAKKFVRNKKMYCWNANAIDEGLLVDWFANFKEAVLHHANKEVVAPLKERLNEEIEANDQHVKEIRELAEKVETQSREIDIRKNQEEKLERWCMGWGKKCTNLEMLVDTHRRESDEWQQKCREAEKDKIIEALRVDLEAKRSDLFDLGKELYDLKLAANKTLDYRKMSDAKEDEINALQGKLRKLEQDIELYRVVTKCLMDAAKCATVAKEQSNEEKIYELRHKAAEARSCLDHGSAKIRDQRDHGGDQL